MGQIDTMYLHHSYSRPLRLCMIIPLSKGEEYNTHQLSYDRRPMPTLHELPNFAVTASGNRYTKLTEGSRLYRSQ